MKGGGTSQNHKDMDFFHKITIHQKSSQTEITLKSINAGYGGKREEFVFFSCILQFRKSTTFTVFITWRISQSL